MDYSMNATPAQERQLQAQMNYRMGYPSPFLTTYPTSQPSPFFQRSASVEATISGRNPLWQTTGVGPTGAPAPFTRGKPAYHAAHICSSNFQTMAARLQELISTNPGEAAQLIQDCISARSATLQPGSQGYAAHKAPIDLLDNLHIAFTMYPMVPGTQVRYADGPMRFILKDPSSQYLTVTVTNITPGAAGYDLYGGKKRSKKGKSKATRKQKHKKTRKLRTRRHR